MEKRKIRYINPIPQKKWLKNLANLTKPLEQKALNREKIAAKLW